MTKDKAVTFKTTQEVADQIGHIAAKYGQTKSEFIHTVMLRGVFGHIYTVEAELHKALKEAVSENASPVDIKMFADIAKNLLYRIAEERSNRSITK